MKIVKENINFERGLDPKKALDIGNNYTPKKGDTFKAWRGLENRWIKVESLENKPSESWSKWMGIYWDIRVKVLDNEYKGKHDISIGTWDMVKKYENAETDGNNFWYMVEY